MCDFLEVKSLKVLEVKQLHIPEGKAKVQFIRIDPEDMEQTLSDILKAMMDLSWLKNFDKEYVKQSFRERATITINDIKRKFNMCVSDKLTSDAGEYLVSELARETLVGELKYMNIPLGELLGKKISGNPGFDFHSQNNLTDTIIFGEAKYLSNRCAYSDALCQINNFITEKKDIKDIADLEHFCSDRAMDRAVKGKKGFAAAFSAKSTSSKRILSAIMAKDEFKKLTNYEELILVAVDL